MHAHNLPPREAPVRGTTKDQIKTFHKVNVVTLNKNPIQWHHDVINIIFKLNLIKFNFDKNFVSKI